MEMGIKCLSAAQSRKEVFLQTFFHLTHIYLHWYNWEKSKIPRFTKAVASDLQSSSKDFDLMPIITSSAN